MNYYLVADLRIVGSKIDEYIDQLSQSLVKSIIEFLHMLAVVTSKDDKFSLVILERNPQVFIYYPEHISFHRS